MKPRTVFITLCLLPIVLVGTFFLTRGPSYKGRTAAQWFQKMKMPAESAELDPGLIALKVIGAPAVPAIQKQLKSPMDADRFRAAWVLGHLGAAASNAVPDLIEALDDKEMTVQLNAYRALSTIGTSREDLVPRLLSELRDPDWRISGSAADLLIGIEKRQKAQSFPEPTNKLERAMAFLHATAPYARVRGLPRFLELSHTGENVTAAFESLLNDPNGWVREETARLLKKHHLPEEKLIPTTQAANLTTVFWHD